MDTVDFINLHRFLYLTGRICEGPVAVSKEQRRFVDGACSKNEKFTQKDIVEGSRGYRAEVEKQRRALGLN